MKTQPFDVSAYLDSDEMIAEYLNAALEENDDTYFMRALGHVAKAKGMSHIAEETGLGRESLYKALSGNVNAQFSTVQKVLSSMGLSIHIQGTNHSC